MKMWMAAAAAALTLAAAPLAIAAQASLAGDQVATSGGALTIHPVNHASFVMSYGGKIIYVDPVGGIDPYLALPKPDLILITDIHGDHMNAGTLNAIVSPGTPIVAPAAVRAALPANLQARVRVLG